ncbi:MAG: lipooligosaccharide sialyltransferase [Lachnospiraceae bacterium]|nr:lipooligosaccharide sialyltransferase [Lachnospiraceae bacterium]
MSKPKNKSRIYVCHTYYHVYVSFLKEFSLPKKEQGTATLVLSKLSTHFEKLKERVAKSGVFAEIYEYDEKRQTAYPELAKYTIESKNPLANMIRRIIMTKKFGRLCEQDIPVNFEDYQDIYVYCDIDPIGYYLNWKHIPYHAMEDGLNCLKNFNLARYDNRGFFSLKAFMSSKLNLIFVQDGYGKYCIDMEVNDLSVIQHPYSKYVEVKRQELVDRLTPEEKDLILRVFVRDLDTLKRQIRESLGQDKIMILTEPLCDLKTRERLFRDLITEYEKEGHIYIKPHPRDELDYKTLFAEYPQIDGTVPMEMLNFFDGFRVKKIVSVFTELDEIKFADEMIRLGPDFMDKYEPHEMHNQTEVISK